MMCDQSNKSTLIREGYRLSELSLSSDASAADAADQRASSFSGLLLAGAALLTGLYDPETQKYGLLVSAAVLVIAAAICGYSARPQKFYFPGARFDDLEQDYARDTPLNDVMKELGQFNDKHSRMNREALRRNAGLMRIAYVTAITGLIIGISSQAWQ